jgi:hypothetical protein
MPDDIHEAEFGFGEVLGFGARQGFAPFRTKELRLPEARILLEKKAVNYKIRTYSDIPDCTGLVSA